MSKCILRALLISATGVILLVNSPAFADQFTYLTQSRSVIAAINGVNATSQTINAPDFLEFNATANVNGSSLSGSSTQPQDSILGPASIAVHDNAATGAAPAFAGAGQATGESIIDVTFNVTSPVSDMFSATISDNFELPGNPLGKGLSGSNLKREVQLSGPGTNISWTLWGVAGSDSFSQVIPLDVGQYHLVIDIQSLIQAGSDSTEFAPGDLNVQLTAPEPAFNAVLCIGAIRLIAKRQQQRN
jgi:hypothetical protein